MTAKLNRKKRAAKKTASAAYDPAQRAAAQRKFLAATRAGASGRQAADIAGIPRGTIYRWRNEDPDFAQAWLESRDTSLQDLEVAAFKRAIEGNDRLLVFLLKSHMPQTYNQRQQSAAPDKSQDFAFTDIAERLRQCS